MLFFIFPSIVNTLSPIAFLFSSSLSMSALPAWGVCVCGGGYKKKTLDTGDETQRCTCIKSVFDAISTGIYENIFL